MAAYLIALIEVTDPEGYEEYKPIALESITQYGGRYLARGGRRVVLEGDIDAERVTVVEFESLEALQRWYDSPEYEHGKSIRQRTSRSRLIAVEGL